MRGRAYFITICNLYLISYNHLRKALTHWITAKETWCNNDTTISG
jgi:hypothetical protein